MLGRYLLVVKCGFWILRYVSTIPLIICWGGLLGKGGGCKWVPFVYHKKYGVFVKSWGTKAKNSTEQLIVSNNALGDACG